MRILFAVWLILWLTHDHPALINWPTNCFYFGTMGYGFNLPEITIWGGTLMLLFAYEFMRFLLEAARK